MFERTDPDAPDLAPGGGIVVILRAIPLNVLVPVARSHPETAVCDR